jgi:non-haem Fe2+, alpha-ketoglutarate-dependent halogenase
MTNLDPQCFKKEGYCLFPNVFSEKEVVSNRSLLDEATDSGSLDRANYFGEPHTLDDRWLGICRHPRLLDAVQSVLGTNLILVYSSVFIKPPNSTDTVGWHQDIAYWPSVHGTDVITVWLALDDASAENSAMKVIPETHTGHREQGTVTSEVHEMLDRKTVITPEMEAKAVTLEMSAGSLSIHDSYLQHSSEANRTERRRAGYTIRFCNRDTVSIDLEQHPIPVYLVRGQAAEDRYVDIRPLAI